MPCEEFYGWLAYHSLYPIDGSREDYRAAMIAHAIVAVMGGGKNKLEDFIVKFGETYQQQPIEQSIAYFKSLAARNKRQG